MFLNKGFSGDDLTRIVDLITADRTRWVRAMITEEYGLPGEVRSPWMAALATFSAFIACGLVPLLPHLIGLNNPVTLSMLMTGGVFFAIGSVKSRWSTAPWWKMVVSKRPEVLDEVVVARKSCPYCEIPRTHIWPTPHVVRKNAESRGT